MWVDQQPPGIMCAFLYLETVATISFLFQDWITFAYSSRWLVANDATRELGGAKSYSPDFTTMSSCLELAFLLRLIGTRHASDSDGNQMFDGELEDKSKISRSHSSEQQLKHEINTHRLST